MIDIRIQSTVLRSHPETAEDKNTSGSSVDPFECKVPRLFQIWTQKSNPNFNAGRKPRSLHNADILNAELELEEGDELAIMFATFSFALINVLLIFRESKFSFVSGSKC